MTQKTARKNTPADHPVGKGDQMVARAAGKGDRPVAPTPPLPEGWEWVTLQDIAGESGIFKDGDWVESKDQDPNGDVRLIQLADIGDGDYRNKSSRYLTYEKAIELRCTFLNPGDVLIARMPDPLGRACIFPGDKKKSVTVVDVCIVRSGILQTNHKWIMYAINAPQFRNNVSKFQSGSTRKRISRKNLAKIRLPLPPRPEQERIVAKIEALFSHLEAAQTMLERTQRNLKRYRAAVLKAAVEGTLLPPLPPDAQGESGAQLLQRILAERRARWEAEEWEKLVAKAKQKAAQARRKAHGQPARLSDIPEAEWQAIPEAEYQRHLPKNDKWKAKYKEPAPPDTANLPPLPPNWAWATVEMVADVMTGATPLRSEKRYWTNGKIPWVTSGAVNREFIAQADEFITEEALQETNVKMFPKGSLLVALYGEGKTRGKITELQIDATTNQACAALVFESYSIEVKPFVKVFFLHNYENIRRMSSGGVQPNLNLTIVKETAIPLPPLTEQEHIVAEVERRLAAARRLEETVAVNLRRLARLRQAILKAAFAGRL